MPLTFHDSMDPHSLDIKRDGKFIGYLQWHPNRPPRIVLMESLGSISLDEAQECIAKYQDILSRNVITGQKNYNIRHNGYNYGITRTETIASQSNTAKTDSSIT